ncbi:hypothetical protein J1N35_034114 [Gossypium stocksii]|uniref:Putative plant transposon protein domain-containing protein n=1 Tax=Gossypium stocksii TaxID=47602 RepID=A0A9D3ZPR6_9ROSI|nr:hypothetical protein J1N35_034114 [Gossypium stocksii]
MAHIRQVDKTLNWALFCKKRPSMDEELVCEFYANLTSSKLMEVQVHEIKVPITSNTINEFFELLDFENDEYSSLMSNIETDNLQEILAKLTIPGSKWTVSKPLMWEKIILREMWNCAIRCSGPTYFPFTITILCLKAKILANIKKTGYSPGTITDWDLYQIAGDSILQQRVKESEELKKEEDPTEIESLQSAEIPDKVEPMEPEAELDVTTPMFRTQSPRPDLRDEL